MVTQDEIEMDASLNSAELPPAVASTSGGYPPAIPSTSYTEITGGRVEMILLHPPGKENYKIIPHKRIKRW